MNKKITPSEKYMFLLGQASILADLHTLLTALPKEKRYDLTMEWVNLMKSIYEQANIWEKAEKI